MTKGERRLLLLVAGVLIGYLRGLGGGSSHAADRIAAAVKEAVPGIDM